MMINCSVKISVHIIKTLGGVKNELWKSSHYHKVRNPCSKRIFYSGKKRVAEAMAKSRRTLESSTTTTATAEEVAAHFKNHHVNTVAI